MKKVFCGDILAILPKYIEGRGNCTVVVKGNGENLILDKNIKTTIGLLGKYYMIDLNEVRKRYGEIVLSKNLIPIPLSKNDILVPLKTRYPIFKNDGAFGYINYRFITNIKRENMSTWIYMKDDYIVECLCSLETVHLHLKDASIISRCYEGYGIQVAEQTSLYKYL